MTRRSALPALLLLGLLAAAGGTGYLLQGGRDREAASVEHPLLRLAGAFRVFVVEALWMEMQADLSEGREGKVLSTARTLLELEPDSARTRSFLHGFLAFTMARKAVSEEEAAEWIREGFAVLEEGLARDEGSWILNREMGLSLFVRTEYPEAAFDQVCLERFGGRPVELAPRYLERALATAPDPAEIAPFLAAAAASAGYFALRNEAYDRAARLFGVAREHAAAWFSELSVQDRAEAERCYADLESYALLKARAGEAAEKGEESSTENDKKAEALMDRIRRNPFFRPSKEREP